MVASPDSVGSVKSTATAAPVATATTASAVGFFSGLLNSFGLGPGSGKGAVPLWDGSILSGVLEWARREIESLFFNKTPTADPAQMSQTGDGVVIGFLNAADANGNPLAFDVTSAPVHGTVVVGDDGRYTYTSDPSFAEEGGMDSFVVQVRDTGLHLNFWVSSSISVTVPVTVSANVVPVEAEPPTMSAPSRSTGLVSGAVHVTDANGNPLTYTVTTLPEKGVVSVDDLGDFIYEPTEAARRAVGARNASEAARVDFFAITVSDGRASIEVPVTVPVAPLNDTQVDTISLGGSPQGLAFSKGGSRAYVSNQDGTVSIIDTASRELVGTLSVGGNPGSLVISPDGTKLYVSQSADNTVSVFDADSGNLIGEPIAVGEYPDAIAADPTGTYVYVANTNSGSISAIATADNAVTSITVGSAPYALAISSDGNQLYVADFVDGNISVIDTATNTVVAQPIEVGGSPSALALSADDQTLYATDYYTGSLSIIDLADLDATSAVIGRNPTALAMSADGSRVYVTSRGDNMVSVFDSATGRVVTDINVGNGPGAMAFSPDGSQLYVANEFSGTVSVISVLENIGNIGSGTQGFYVINTTGHPITYGGASYHGGDIDGGPAVGAVIQPGQQFGFELDDYWLGTTDVVVQFHNDQGTNFEVYMHIPVSNDVESSCSTSGANAACAAGGRVIFLEDPPNSVATIPASNVQGQNFIMDRCVENWASCNFQPTEQQETYTPYRQLGATVTNNTALIQQRVITDEYTVESSSNWQASARVQATLKGIVEVELAFSYGHSWGESHTFSESYTVSISPYSKSTVSWANPLYVNLGNYVIKLGNTTFTLPGAVFKSPDPNRPDEIVYDEKPYNPVPPQLQTQG